MTQEVNRILRRYRNDASDIIAILQDVQQTYRYLPRDVMEQLAHRLDIPLSRVYHLATFFRAFSLEPRGKHELQVCMGTACHVRGSPRILEALERNLKIQAGQTTLDSRFTLETVNCVGACALGPVVVVDGKSKGKLNPQRAERLLKQIEPEKAEETPARKRPPAKARKRAAAPSKKKAPARRAASGTKKQRKAPKKAKSKVSPSPRRAKSSRTGRKAAKKRKTTRQTAKKARR